ncbi:MAG TPA: tyrosine-protein phosphatase, partial [Phycisphaerae bacterium]|nr:tyrosine-protein phosphatase [Phycisphaerae bacterium]
MTTRDPPASGKRPRRRRWLRRIVAVAAIAVVVAAGVSYALIKARVWRAPYPPLGKDLCWVIGCREEAYNFDVVVPGRVYRSSRPDERFFRYVHRKYGIRRVVMLNAADANRLDSPPDELGIERHFFRWFAEVVPPRDELRRVMEILDSNEPVLVHCWAGADRTGYAVAAYRILRQGWQPEQAFAEMNRYWHFPRRKPALQADLRKLAEPNSLNHQGH